MKITCQILMLLAFTCLIISCSESDEFNDRGTADLKSRAMIQYNHSFRGLDKDRYVTMSPMDI